MVKVTVSRTKESVSGKYASAHILFNDNGKVMFGHCSFDILATIGGTRI